MSSCVFPFPSGGAFPLEVLYFLSSKFGDPVAAEFQARAGRVRVQHSEMVLQGMLVEKPDFTTVFDCNTPQLWGDFPRQIRQTPDLCVNNPGFKIDWDRGALILQSPSLDPGLLSSQFESTYFACGVVQSRLV